MKEEAVIQKQPNMLTSFQLEAIKAVERIGGGAKVSGAGGGGVIVAFAPDRERLPEIRLSLQDLNYTEVQLTVDTQGITVEAAGKPFVYPPVVGSSPTSNARLPQTPPVRCARRRPRPCIVLHRCVGPARRR